MRRLSVHADIARIDVAVSDVMPVESLMPALVDALTATGEFETGHAATRYQLRAPDGTAFDPSKTLSELGVRDGTTVTLDRSPTALGAPRSDDAAEAVGVAVATVERRWTGQITRFVGALVASCLAGAGAVVAQRAACVGVAAATTLLALGAAAAAQHVFGKRDAALMLGLMATGLSGLTGLLAVPGGPGAPNALVAAAAAATSAAVLRVIGCHAVVFSAIACFSATCAATALTCVLTAEPFAVVGAGLATVSLASIEAAPSVSLLLARLTPDQQDDRSGQWDGRAVQAHTWLVGLVAAFSASAALGAVGVVSRLSTASTVFAAVIGGTLVLRARVHLDAARAASLIICGAVTLGAALVAAAHSGHAPHIVVLSTGLSFLALYLGFADGPIAAPAALRRGIELLEYCGFAAMVPLTLWLCGLFAVARSANLS